MKDAAFAIMIVGLAFLVAASFATPAILARFGLPPSWAENNAAVYGIFGAISAIGGVLWWIGWQRKEGGK